MAARQQKVCHRLPQKPVFISSGNPQLPDEGSHNAPIGSGGPRKKAAPQSFLLLITPGCRNPLKKGAPTFIRSPTFLRSFISCPSAPWLLSDKHGRHTRVKKTFIFSWAYLGEPKGRARNSFLSLTSLIPGRLVVYNPPWKPVFWRYRAGKQKLHDVHHKAKRLICGAG